MKILAVYAIAIAIAFLGGCVKQSAWTRADEWYRPGTETSISTMQQLPDADVSLVSRSGEKLAESLLKDKAFVRITVDQASDFCGRDMPKPGNAQYYLVRGVYLNEGTGKFAAYSSDGQVLVCHGSLGHFPVPMKKRALVLRLHHEPTAVYSTCSMAE